MVLPITQDCPGPVICQPAGIPRTDPGYTHPFPVCLMLTAFLDIPLSPQMQLLFLISRYLSLHLQLLEYDNVRMVFFCISADCPGDLPR